MVERIGEGRYGWILVKARESQSVGDGVQCDATNQKSRAQAMVGRNIKVIPVEVVRMWLDGSGASLGVDNNPPGAASPEGGQPKTGGTGAGSLKNDVSRLL